MTVRATWRDETAGHSPTPDRSRPIYNRHGERRTGAQADDYPLTGRCVCGRHIVALSGPDPWLHVTAAVADAAKRVRESTRSVTPSGTL